MPKWPWIERSFRFDFPPTKWPDLLERIHGTPARIEDRIHGLADQFSGSDDLSRPARGVLTRRPDGGGWSIQQNIGHLIDLGYLPMRRIEQILAGEATLIAADMSNKKTIETDHNARGIADLLNEFRSERRSLVARFESLSEDDWACSALHPRLQQPMRIVDIAYFDAEHDDYHLGRIGELIRAFTS